MLGVAIVAQNAFRDEQIAKMRIALTHHLVLRSVQLGRAVCERVDDGHVDDAEATVLHWERSERAMIFVKLRFGDVVQRGDHHQLELFRGGSDGIWLVRSHDEAEARDADGAQQKKAHGRMEVRREREERFVLCDLRVEPVLTSFERSDRGAQETDGAAVVDDVDAVDVVDVVAAVAAPAKADSLALGLVDVHEHRLQTTFDVVESSGDVSSLPDERDVVHVRENDDVGEAIACFYQQWMQQRAEEHGAEDRALPNTAFRLDDEVAAAVDEVGRRAVLKVEETTESREHSVVAERVSKCRAARRVECVGRVDRSEDGSFFTFGNGGGQQVVHPVHDALGASAGCDAELQSVEVCFERGVLGRENLERGELQQTFRHCDRAHLDVDVAGLARFRERDQRAEAQHVTSGFGESVVRDEVQHDA